jgi:hypothetical protein
MGRSLLLGFAAALWAASANATVIVFQADLAGFDAAAGSPPIAIDFDAITPGTDIAGAAIAGATFTSPDGNTLEVVLASATFTPSGFTGVVDASTNVLIATSGLNVLSPGGAALVPGSALAQEDSLQIVFASPQSAVGLDVLFQSFDVAPAVTFTAYGPGGGAVASGSFVGSGGAGSPGAAIFLGFVSDSPSTHISRILITETDGNASNPDCNIGFDSVRLFVPEPEAGLLLMAAAA